MFPSQNTKYLIVHADDFGMCHSVNTAIIETIQQGVVTSTSIMVPCPWVVEAAEFLRANPIVDVGVHLTVTSEWQRYRWRPLTHPGPESGLTDLSGYFSQSATSIPASYELELELLAQIEFAKKLGISPTHLDSHMFALFGPEDRLQLYARVARTASLPFLILPRLKSLTDWHMPIDSLVFMEGRRGLVESWSDWYDSILRALQPGLTELIVHPGFNDTEMRAVAGDSLDCGAAWRQKDYEVLTSARFRQSIQENNIELTTWAKISRIFGYHKPES